MSIFHVEDGFFGQPKVQEAYNYHIFLIFDGKQHPKNIWFRGLKSPLTSVLKIVNKIDLLKIINLYSKTTIISAAHCCEKFETDDIDNSEIIVGQIDTTGTSEVEFIQD